MQTNRTETYHGISFLLALFSAVIKVLMQVNEVPFDHGIATVGYKNADLRKNSQSISKGIGQV